MTFAFSASTRELSPSYSTRRTSKYTIAAAILSVLLVKTEASPPPTFIVVGTNQVPGGDRLDRRAKSKRFVPSERLRDLDGHCFRYDVCSAAFRRGPRRRTPYPVKACCAGRRRWRSGGGRWRWHRPKRR